MNLSNQGPQNDDGPAAMRSARRRGVHASAEADGSPEALARYRERKARWRKYATTENRRRWRAMRRAREKEVPKQRYCVDCHATISRWNSTRCQSCAWRNNHQETIRVRAQQELARPFQDGRNLAHERNVSRLEQTRLDLPL